MPPFYRICISCIAVKFITWKTLQSWYATLLFPIYDVLPHTCISANILVLKLQ